MEKRAVATAGSAARAAHAVVVMAALAVLTAAARAGAAGAGGAEAALPAFEFTRPEEVKAWRPAHDLGPIEATAEGMVLEITGPDPYAMGPPRDFPADVPVWLDVRLKAERAGVLQVFYCPRGKGPAEERSVRVAVAGGEWQEARLPLPALGPGAHLRLDPPGDGGRVVVSHMRFEARPVPVAPRWPVPAGVSETGHFFTVGQADGAWAVRHGEGGLGDFEVRAGGERMAVGVRPTLIGYVRGRDVRWISTADGTAARRGSGQDPSGETAMVLALRDPDGGTWRLEHRFPAAAGGAAVEVHVTVDQPRDVFFLPMLLVSAGVGTFGEAKGQALLAGLEYLENEPSSSEADVRGPASRRQVPDSLKITMPLMAVQAKDRYVGLAWEPDARFAAVFDSPDRLFGTGGHVMGLVFPGSDGASREEGALLPYAPGRLEAGRPLVLKARLLAGRGSSVVDAVRDYVGGTDLPPVPEAGMDWAGYARLAAGGWMDSKGREGDLYRHAVWPGFGAQPAADAAVMMEYLAAGTADAALAGRLREAARAAIARVRPADYYHSGVGHVRYPVAPLVYGHVAEAVERARASGRGTLKRFEADGSLLYRQAEGKPDYASTHTSREANGLAAGAVAGVLEAAAFSGDPDLLREGIRLARALDKFAGTVPRGAQTWEVPLHTPDILASAHLVRAYTLAYELTGDAHFRDAARYWAWTGVPFVYLVNPADRPVGPYGTVAVYGATNWVAPVWFGLPVQWCGLVYAEALYRLARHDGEGPWRRLADGISATGVQFTWKADDRDRQGLLPDFFHLRAQRPDGPAINPATVQACAVRLFGRPPVYDFRAVRPGGMLVHAPGEIAEARHEAGRALLRVRPWVGGPYRVLVGGLSRRPQVRVNGADVPASESHEYLATGHLVLRLEGEARVELTP